MRLVRFGTSAGRASALGAGGLALTAANVPTGGAPTEGVPRLDVSLAGDPASLAVGQRVTYTAIITNNGGPAAAPFLVDTLPNSMVYQSATGSVDGPCTVSGKVVTCPLGVQMDKD